MYKTVYLIVAVLLASLFFTSEMTIVVGEPSVQPQVFRLLAIEQKFDGFRMRSAQLFIKELLKHPNWNNSTDEHVSFIHLLSLYNRSEVYDEVRPFWIGTLSRAELEREIKNFLGNASGGEIVILYYCGHSYVYSSPPPSHSRFLGISPSELRSWLNSTLSQAYITLVLDTCYSGYWADFSPRANVLAACGKHQMAWGWGGGAGIFTLGLMESLQMTVDSNNDGWLSLAEVFPHAKNFTETIVTWANQNPESHYAFFGAVEGDLPLVQIDQTKPFPEWDIAITNVLADSSKVEPCSSLSVQVHVVNRGDKAAVFDVNLHVDSTVVSTELVLLFPGENTTLTLFWGTCGFYGIYETSSTLSMCPGEINMADNYRAGSFVTVAFIGDINLDRVVDVRDVAVAAQAFGSHPEHPRWNPNADVNEDGKIDTRDTALVSKDFGKTYP